MFTTGVNRAISIGVIGNGFVGKATNLLKCDKIDIITYDIVPGLCSPLGLTIQDIIKCDIIFISVPTPMNKDGSCYLGMVESAIGEIAKRVNMDETLVVLRSTVPVGTCDRLNCYFMPEFLTEKNFENDFIENPNWIFGLKGTEQDNLFKKQITKLINISNQNGKIKHNTCSFVTNKESEMIKLFRNNYLAVKVSFCNEMEEFCRKKDIDYDNVRKLATLDERIGESHTVVPGHDGSRGYGGTCFPKDTNNLKCEMEKINMKSYIINAAVTRNEQVDRPEKDWNSNQGRAVV